MEELKQVVQIAEEYLRVLYPDLNDLQVEEVERPVPGEGWLITLSFVRKEETAGLVALSMGSRAYKQFHIVGGEVRSMKIRELSGA